MRPSCIVLAVVLGCVLASASDETSSSSSSSSSSSRTNVQEEMQLINKSLEGLLAELATIRREATGRLSQTRGANKLNSANEQERIRQTKVSRFVLKRVAELELESLGMRDEMVKLFELQKKTESSLMGRSLAGNIRHQEDLDFDEQPATTTTTAAATSSTTAAASSTTASPSEQEAQLGFDLEQLKRLGNELESEIEARQAQGAESVRGVHEQVIKLVDNMVQNYLGNMRRAVQRFTNLIDNRRQPAATGQQPRQSPGNSNEAELVRGPEVHQAGQRIVSQLEEMSTRLRQFATQWPALKTAAGLQGRQQSPLIDRIPPRGVELWRDFWDTVRKQVRRINEEFVQLTRDMGRVLTGRPPSTGSRVIIRPGGRDDEAATQAGELVAPILNELLYSSSSLSAAEAQTRDHNREQVRQQFQEFYDKLTAQLAKEQAKMNELIKSSGQPASSQQLDQSLFDEMDDEVTRQELANNVALRQQIQQEINVFGSIFDIMRTFIARLRDSASTIRDILTPPGAIFDNNPVTPGPSVKPTVDKLLEDTINSQRNINSQARPTSRD